MDAKHTPDDFTVLHRGNSKMRGITFAADDLSRHGEMMDAADFLPIGCTSARQDMVERCFNATEAFVEVCLLQGFGKNAHMTAFEYECYTGRAAIAKATGSAS